MDTCKYCGQSNDHVAACPAKNQSKSLLVSWNVGFACLGRGISIPDGMLRGYTPTFQLGYQMGKRAHREPFVLSGGKV